MGTLYFVSLICSDTDGLAIPSVRVVKGPYPVALLDAWDAYKNSPTLPSNYSPCSGGSSTTSSSAEDLRPDFYSADQLFCVVSLEDGGLSLSHFKLHSWAEAFDIFWQVALTLKCGEEACEFEVNSNL